MSALTDRIGGMIADWQATRAALREIEEREHPDITDRHGRVWVWRSGDLYAHDATLAMPRDFVTHPRLGLPRAECADNPNYWRLCATCRSEWPGPVQLELFEGWGHR